MLRDVRLGFLALFLCSAACAPARQDALLIRIDGVEQALERPDELILRGEGFPPGMRGEARLRGALYAAGGAPRAVDLRATCRALGPRGARIELAAASARIAGEGPFEGAIEVRFGTQQDAQVLGRSERALFRLGRAPLIEEQFALSQRAEHFQRALGIESLEQGEGGLRVAEISGGSAAGQAGLTVHDLVLRMDGRPVQLARDLVALDDTREVLLEVRRPGEGKTRIVRIATSHADASPDLVLVLLALCLGVGLGIVLACALPSHVLWAPRRSEYWLLLCCAVCTVGLGALIVRDIDPLLSRMSEALVLGASCAGFAVYLRRRLSPTLRTSKDPDLAPLL
jgi:hypothetical protein